MRIGDLRDMAHECHWQDEVVFEDADGNIHQVYTAVRARVIGGTCKIILRETTEKDFEFKVDKNPPAELIDRLDRYNETIDAKNWRQ